MEYIHQCVNQIITFTPKQKNEVIKSQDGAITTLQIYTMSQ